MPDNNEDMIDLNVASAEDLKDVSFMGDKRAKALVIRREKHGPFKSWRDIETIPGFSTVMVRALQDRCYIRTETDHHKE
jgi:competence ComEA-like helix-hairpin-helix protein